MRRKTLNGTPCPLSRTLNVIGDWWSLLIIRDAFAGIRRFKDFHRSLGAAKNILTTRLKSLVAEGVLKIVPASDGTAYQEYVLTEKGEALLPILVTLSQWGNEYQFCKGEKSSVMIDARKRRPLPKLQIRSADGRLLQRKDVLVSIP